MGMGTAREMGNLAFLLGEQRWSMGWLQAEGWQELGFIFQFPAEPSMQTCKQPHCFRFHLLQNYIYANQ